MAGTVEGGKKAAATNKARHGEDFFRIQGAKGGRLGRTGGTYRDPEMARRIGKLGGARSRRGHKLLKVEEKHLVYLNLKTNKKVIVDRNDG